MFDGGIKLEMTDQLFPFWGGTHEHYVPTFKVNGM
jgi:hypothetical protein